MRRLPRYIAAMHRIAERAGLRVDVNEHGDELLCVWRGTKGQLRKTGLIRPGFQFPTVQRAFCVPPDQGNLSRELSAALVDGEMIPDGAYRIIITAKYRVPDSIEDVGGVEVCRYAATISAHGTAPELLASGLCEKRHITNGKRPNRSHRVWDNDEPQWVTRGLLDGTYLHVRETEVEAKRRYDADKKERESWACEKEQPTKQEPQSADEYREACDAVSDVLFHVHKVLGYKRTAAHVPFRYDDDTLDAVHVAMATIMDHIRNSPIIQLREPVDPERLKAVAEAEGDTSFQRFLSTVTRA